MDYWLYLLFGFLGIWLVTMFILWFKGRKILFYVSTVLPVFAVFFVFLLTLVIVLLPLIYLVLFFYSLITPSTETINYGRRIEVE